MLWVWFSLNYCELLCNTIVVITFASLPMTCDRSLVFVGISIFSTYQTDRPYIAGIYLKFEKLPILKHTEDTKLSI